MWRVGRREERGSDEAEERGNNEARGTVEQAVTIAHGKSRADWSVRDRESTFGKRSAGKVVAASA